MKLLKRLLIILVLGGITFGMNVFQVSAAVSSNYTQLSPSDRGTFNEYRYKITREFFKLRETFEIDSVIDTKSANAILQLASQWYKYLPDNLDNENAYNTLITALKRGIKYPNNDSYYSSITQALNGFVDKAKIDAISWRIEANPIQWNAPLVSTFRARVEDPSWTKVTDGAFTWWMDQGGRRIVIGTKPSISYNFTKEGSYTIFLDVRSAHKNSKGFTDVLPYTGKIQVQVREKIASVILRVWSNKVGEDWEIKIAPEEAQYGIVFDATSSVPSSGTRFLETAWDFGNGVVKRNDGSPKIERITYSREWDYPVVLQLKTNQGQVIQKRFQVSIHKPIAKIIASQSEWYMWDKFSFRAQASWRSNTDLVYNWEIVDLSKDKIIFSKWASAFQYSFVEKGRYSLRLKINDPAGNVDIDTKDIYINSRAPIPNIQVKRLLSNKPNEIFLDATSTYDPDFSDDGKLKYRWIIDWQRVNLWRPNKDGSNWYFTFDTIGQHSVILEVEDPDEIVSIAKSTVNISSIMSVDLWVSPRVVQREGSINIVADAPLAKFYEWNFWDGTTVWWTKKNITHQYKKSGMFTITLTVRWANRSDSNSVSKVIYVWNSKNPVAIIDLSKRDGFDYIESKWVCDGKDAYMLSRDDNMTFQSNSSIDTNGQNSWLAVSWKVGADKFATSQSMNLKFDELGCFPVKLTVRSIKDKTSDSRTIWVKVENKKPTLSSLSINPVDLNADPVVVNISAVGARDEDGVVQSYVWYYTTDADSEPQDFRVTRNPSTTFVLPKIPWNYHFGVVLKDNNEEKVSSEDIIWKNSITLTGDNLNTPLIEFKTNDSSVGIWDTVEFKADAENVLGKSIEKTATYSWDFDGDGFYDSETQTWKASHTYQRSGTFYAKVKVKNKGFSNTRTITMNVSNTLVSDFDYISIGNKYVFLDKSKWKVDSQSWDLGDWSEKKDTWKFVHEYNDKKSVHEVELTVAEGTKVKKNTKKVVKDVKNVLKARRPWLNVFSHPWVSWSWTITIDKEESIFIYMWESKGDFSNYWIDYDIDTDSDVNWWKDDDVDNIDNSSYKTWDPEEIVLNEFREQTIRLFLLDTDLNVVDSKDITIIKTYIDEKEEVNPDDIKLEWVTDWVKKKFEELKTIASSFEWTDRIKAMSYIQRLQENWSDDAEKTRTIIEFEGFIDETGVENADETIDLLESLLVEWEDDKSEKNIAYKALQALMPQDIQCATQWESCSDLLSKKLEQIKQSSDVEWNRAIGKEILQEIGKDTNLSEKEKNDFKAILKVLVYSWVDNIPDAEVQEIVEETTKSQSESQTWSNKDINSQAIGTWEEWDNKLMTFLKKIGWWAAGIFWILLLIMFVIWILDFLKNRKSWESFEDFVAEKTSDDVLGEVGSDDDKKIVDPLEGDKHKKEDSNKSALFSDTPEKVEGEEGTANKVSVNADIPDTTATVTLKDSTTEDDDWMDDFWKEKPFDTVETDLEVWVDEDVEKGDQWDKNTFEEWSELKNDGDIPDWLSWSVDSNNTEDSSGWEFLWDKPQSISEDSHKEGIEIEDDIDVEKVTQIEDNSTPDWLKESMIDKLPKKKNIEDEDWLDEDSVIDDLNEKPLNQEEEKEEEMLIEEDEEEKIDLENDIPDWLKDTAEWENKELNENDTREDSVDGLDTTIGESEWWTETSDDVLDFSWIQEEMSENMDDVGEKEEGAIERPEDEYDLKLDIGNEDSESEIIWSDDNSSDLSILDDAIEAQEEEWWEGSILGTEDTNFDIFEDWVEHTWENKDSNTDTVKSTETDEIDRVVEEDVLWDIDWKDDKNADQEVSKDSSKKEASSSDDNIPDWLRGSLDEDDTTKEVQRESTKPFVEDIQIDSEDDSRNNAKIDVDDNKKTDTAPVDTKHKDNKALDLQEKKKSSTNHLGDVDVPDWLQDSLTEESFENKIQKEKSNTQDAWSEISKKSENQEKNHWQEKKTIVGDSQKNGTEDTSIEEKSWSKKSKKDRSWELWDDGMKVPDWLKTDDD